jgi:hypothetical protein
MVKIKFTKDFATKKKGDTGEYDGQLSNRLIHFLKVAKKYIRGRPKKNEPD